LEESHEDAEFTKTYHANEKPRLLCGAPHACVAHNTNGESSSKTSESNGETRAKLDEAGE